MNIFPRIEILKVVKSLLKEDCKNVFYTDRPDATEDSMKSFVVVRESNVTDLNAYIKCIINLYLFVRDVRNLEDTAKMETLYTSVIDKFPLKVERENGKGWFLFGTPDVGGSRTDGNGFHCVSLNVELIIY